MILRSHRGRRAAAATPCSRLGNPRCPRNRPLVLNRSLQNYWIERPHRHRVVRWMCSVCRNPDSKESLPYSWVMLNSRSLLSLIYFCIIFLCSTIIYTNTWFHSPQWHRDYRRRRWQFINWQIKVIDIVCFNVRFLSVFVWRNRYIDNVFKRVNIKYVL